MVGLGPRCGVGLFEVPQQRHRRIEEPFLAAAGVDQAAVVEVRCEVVRLDQLVADQGVCVGGLSVGDRDDVLLAGFDPAEAVDFDVAGDAPAGGRSGSIGTSSVIGRSAMSQNSSPARCSAASVRMRCRRGPGPGRVRGKNPLARSPTSRTCGSITASGLPTSSSCTTARNVARSARLLTSSTSW